MIFLSFKSVYHLLDRYYLRKTLNSFVFTDTAENVFDSSKLFAIQEQDFVYMDIMVTKRDDLDKKYILFLDGKHNVPFVFERDKDFSILEFAILSKKCEDIGIPPGEFETTLEAQAQGRFADAVECIALFNHHRDTLQGFPVKAETII